MAHKRGVLCAELVVKECKIGSTRIEGGYIGLNLAPKEHKTAQEPGEQVLMSKRVGCQLPQLVGSRANHREAWSKGLRLQRVRSLSVV